MNIIDYLLQDWQVNNDTSFKSRLTLLLFRLTQILTRLPVPFSSLAIVYRIFYQLLVEWVLGIELPWDVKIGSNLKLHHGHALVVNHETIIGSNCTLRHSTTIGNKKLLDGSCSASPKIGNYVDIGSNSVILGPVSIGDHAVIGAGSVIVKDVPAGAVAVGNPARVIRIIDVTSTVNAAALELAAAASNTNSKSHA